MGDDVHVRDAHAVTSPISNSSGPISRRYSYCTSELNGSWAALSLFTRPKKITGQDLLLLHTYCTSDERKCASCEAQERVKKRCWSRGLTAGGDRCTVPSSPQSLQRRFKLKQHDSKQPSVNQIRLGTPKPDRTWQFAPWIALRSRKFFLD